MAKMDITSLSGLAACVVKNGRLIWSKGYGRANIDHRMMRPDALMNIGFVSKLITATAILQLWEEAEFHSDDDIDSVLSFAVRNPFYTSRTITFRQLLTHTSLPADFE